MRNRAGPPRSVITVPATPKVLSRVRSLLYCTTAISMAAGWSVLSGAGADDLAVNLQRQTGDS